jgi:hypothetical protein
VQDLRAEGVGCQKHDRPRNPTNLYRVRSTYAQTVWVTRCHLQGFGLLLNRQMSRFLSPCLACGTLSRNGSYCPTHQAVLDQRHADKRKQIKQTTKQYSGAYTRLAKIVRANATVCAICQLPAIPNDPWQADHLVPASEVTHIEQLRAVHASCNRSRGNKPL